MSAGDRLPAAWRHTRRDPELPGGELRVAVDGESVVFYEESNAAAHLQADVGCLLDVDNFE